MNAKPPILEMTIEGEFVDTRQGTHQGTPQSLNIPFGTRVLIWASIIAAIVIACAVAVFALWLLAVLIPVALASAVIAYGVLRYRMWRDGGSIHWVRRG